MGDAEPPAVDIPGWYDWPDLYQQIVDTAPAGSTVVEVGVFCGKSLCDLAARVIASRKPLRVVGVDTFLGSPEHFAADGLTDTAGRPFRELPPGVLAQATLTNLARLDLLSVTTLIVADSYRASRLIPAAWAVFLDADHSEAAVAADIAAWLPKVQPGGWLCGHDYGTYPGVAAAVDELLPGRTIVGKSWVWRVPKPDPSPTCCGSAMTRRSDSTYRGVASTRWECERCGFFRVLEWTISKPNEDATRE